MSHDPVDPVEEIPGESSVLLSCEHASARMPPGWEWPAEDRRWAETHWAYDLGARALCLELAEAYRAPAVLSRFSRLLIDPNRPEDSETLIRTTVEDGVAVALNAAVSANERDRRLEALYRPYHGALRGRAEDAEIIFAIHTFTPLYEGKRRALEMGVLFDVEEALAETLATAFREAGFETALNEPYSGKEGLIYSADFHARASRARAIEIELRQDLALDRAARRKVVAAAAVLFGRAP
ncbi:MAG: N-formylglutamate amidohydrolase [Myxococcota bacterium]